MRLNRRSLAGFTGSLLLAGAALTGCAAEVPEESDDGKSTEALTGAQQDAARKRCADVFHAMSENLNESVSAYDEGMSEALREAIIGSATSIGGSVTAITPCVGSFLKGALEQASCWTRESPAQCAINTFLSIPDVVVTSSEFKVCAANLGGKGHLAAEALSGWKSAMRSNIYLVLAQLTGVAVRYVVETKTASDELVQAYKNAETTTCNMGRVNCYASTDCRRGNARGIAELYTVDHPIAGYAKRVDYTVDESKWDNIACRSYRLLDGTNLCVSR